MRRTLLRSPAFARDLRKWLKSHSDAAASIAALLELIVGRRGPPIAANPQVAWAACGFLGLQWGLRFARGIRVRAT
jgi:hypothetical protein